MKIETIDLVYFFHAEDLSTLPEWKKISIYDDGRCYRRAYGNIGLYYNKVVLNGKQSNLYGSYIELIL